MDGSGNFFKVLDSFILWMSWGKVVDGSGNYMDGSGSYMDGSGNYVDGSGNYIAVNTLRISIYQSLNYITI